MEISCAFPASRSAVDYTVLAEQLGFRRAWFYDSPAFYPDVWVMLALAAERTGRIGLGPATLIPHLRHPMTQAAAIATLADMAPRRLAVAISTGYTGRRAMGKPQLTRSYFERYIRQLMALLRGETVEVDGAMVRMLHPDGYGAARPIDVPILVGGNGPRGQAFAREIDAAGIVTSAQTVVSGFDWVSPLVFGTVLDEGESPTSPRALAATEGGLVGRYHGAWERDRAALPGLPRGGQWLAAIERIPERERHLAVHEGHLVAPSTVDRSVLDFSELPAALLTGTPADVRERIGALEANGATEVMWQPMGPDIGREMRTFANALGL